VTKRILIMPSPVSSGSVGSITKTVGLAKLLKSMGVDVRFAIGGRLAQFVRAAGFIDIDCPVPIFSGEVRAIGNVIDFLSWAGLMEPEYITHTLEHELAAIRQFKPDVIFAHSRPTAAIAAAITQTPLASIASWPTHPAFEANRSHERQYCDTYNAILANNRIQPVEHVAELLFLRSNLKISPSLPELEPELSVVSEIHYTGYMLDLQKEPNWMPTWFEPWVKSPLIIVYLSVGALKPRIYYDILHDTFSGTEFKVLCASGFHYESKHRDHFDLNDNVQFIEYLPMQNVIERASAVIFHGGQDTMLTTLMHGVPTITFPGQHFERLYNATQLERLGLSRLLPIHSFRRSQIRRTLNDIIDGEEHRKSQEFARRFRLYEGTLHAAKLLTQLT